ncbi:hydroxyproline-2-epimerase [bacterium]|nr:MAG: hydroxyproline-2-epimerase [bacterium]
MRRIRVIDSHTGGEPTRVVLPGEIPLDGATMAERRSYLDSRFAELARGLVREPRGADVWVGAVLTPPVSPEAVCGVVFFTTVGTLGMCGHGTIGVVETLRHLGQVSPGPVVLDTPVGSVRAVLNGDGTVTIENVRSYRLLKDVAVEVDGVGRVVGDVSWGGNWFFIVHSPRFPIDLSQAFDLTLASTRIRTALAEAGVTGENGAEIDHVELFSPEGEVSSNFVLCPGGTYDRSPCGTGTSAKLAGLYADGKLAAGEAYRQRSVTGSEFLGSVQPVEGGVIPTLTGRAWVTAESTYLFAADDPLREGL